MRKITIITGASSGMGAEFARQIYRNLQNKKEEASGDELWLFARSKEKLEGVKNELENVKNTIPESESSETDVQESEASESENPELESEGIKIEKTAEEVRNEERSPKIKVIPMNLAGKEGVNLFKTFLATEKISGGYEIDLVVNNAGFGTYGPFDETDLDRELEMIDLNCTSLTGICGAVLPFLHKGSSIINVASLASFLPLGNFAVYAATKAYVLSFSVALAAELKDKKIKVSALCPGSVSTDFANVASNGVRKEVLNGKDPVKVVEHCLKKAKKGKKIILWNAKWKFTAFMSHFIGRYLCARYTFKYNKRPH
ncbi:SDR family oxidoreductase [uncultured Treponema sp.]|uniref:SDR family NAD(P)-dependent oxidoreductase n=1 Tax=uncultured Treponema sp. TaxID=162155 RepID=UPI0025D26CC3|nr:SDR family NAD(P)-dependent oxidoreductase [uncultured Treponema sp.]